MKKLIVFLVLGLSGLTGYGQLLSGMSAKEASMRIGDSVKVMDKVFGGKLLKSGMTLLNLGGDFPNNPLVLMIKSEDRAKFAYRPEGHLIGKYILVTGRLIEYKGKAEIVVTEPSQISITIPPDPDEK